MARNTATINMGNTLTALSRLERDNLPFAQAVALNETAFLAKAALVDDMPNRFDLRSPRTARGFRVEKASKRQTIQEARVIHLDAWMAIHEFGGTKTSQSGKAMGVPTGDTLTRGRAASGKIRPGFYPRNLLKNPGATDPALAGSLGGRGNRGKGRAKAFVIESGGVSRIVARTRRGADRFDLVGLYNLENSVKVEPRWEVFPTVKRVATRELFPALEAALAKALASSRR